MSIDAVLRSAVSGLNTSQAALRTTADNIANVNTPGYARKIVQQETQVLSGETAGVKLASIQRVINEFVARSLRSATSDSERYAAMTDVHDRVGMLLGDPNENTSLSGRIDQVFTGFSNLASEPDSSVRRTGLINDLSNMATEFSRLASEIQVLRGDVDEKIDASIETVNDALARVKQLNEEIQYATLNGNEGTGLKDQRDQAIAEIAENIDIRLNDMENGAVSISTTNGITLLDHSLRKLVYTPAGSASSATTFNQITVNLVDSSGTVSSVGSALDGRIQGGKLRGLLDMRDTVLPDMALQIGELSGNVIDQLNAVHNDNSPVPPLNSMTGRNTGLATTDQHGFTGSTTMVLLDSNQEITTQIDIDFTAGTYDVNGGGAVAFAGNTIGDVVTDLNAAFGAGATVSFSNGALTFSATASTDGVAIQQGTTPSDRGGRGFSHFFGMNDLLSAGAESHYDTGLTTAMAHGFGATGIATIELRSPDNEVVTTYNLDFSAVGGATMNDVLTDLNTGFSGYATFSLDSNGALVATPASSYSGYKFNVTADTTDRASTGVNFSQFFGLGDRYRTDAANGVTIRSDIVADPAKLALADVDLTAATGVPSLTVADGRGAIAFQNLVSTNVSFSATDELAAVTTTLGTYASQVLARAAVNADQADKLKSDREALTKELQTRNDEISGVNMDEELSNMVTFQNAYNASARLVTTAREMFNTLLQIVG